MQSQQALTNFVSKWCTLYFNVYVPCSSLASTFYKDVSNLSEGSSVSSDYNNFFTCKLVRYPFPLVMQRGQEWMIFILCQSWKKNFLACSVHYNLVSSNKSFIYTSQNILKTGGFPPKHPMIDLYGNIFSPSKMLPRNSPVINLIYLLMFLYTSNIISILSLLVPSFKDDTKIISVR